MVSDRVNLNGNNYVNLESINNHESVLLIQSQWTMFIGLKLVECPKKEV